MKLLSLLFVGVICLTLNSRAQTGTGTPADVGFNPFGGATPTPTISRRALAAVPNPPREKNSVASSRNAEAARNSSVAVTSPTPQSNTRMMTFGNGTRLVRDGDRFAIIDGGSRYFMSRKEATKPPPAMMSRNPCGTIKHYLDTHRCDSFWRHLSLWWADNCL